MWNTTDYKGNPVTWYSQDEMDWLLKKLDDANKCLNDCELHWEKERKTLKEKLNEAHDTNKSLGYTYLRYKEALEEIRKEVQEDITCESRECGCDSYYECLECLKNTILNIISEVKDGNSRKTSNTN